MKSIIQTERECWVCKTRAVLQEQWADVKGYEGLYAVSNLGRIKSLERLIGHRYAGKKRRIPEKIMAICNNGNGYQCVYLVKNKKRRIGYIHRLVAEAFIDNPENKPNINHLDYNTENNRVDNLEWCTQKENINYSKIHMHKRKKMKTNTGERYITQRSNGQYRISIDRKEYKSQNTLEKAIELRNKILAEKGVEI